ncbi:MAG TPA: hypothetical protein VNQ79_00955 [Blastocatellia bacterium]|nr:hypothetical protein [Blastocatellia bacterium]
MQCLKNKVSRNLLNLAICLWLCLLPAVARGADAPAAIAGEITSAGQVSLNGVKASAGTTVFSNTRVRTGADSRTIISLGRAGRIELGALSEMTLRFSGESVGGVLQAGRIVISTPAGIGVSVATADGTRILSEKKDTAMVSLEVTGDTARVRVLRGSVQVARGQQIEQITVGSELSVSQQAGGRVSFSRRLMMAGAAGGVTAGALARGGAAAARTATTERSTLSTLVSTGVEYSLDALTLNRQSRDPRIFFSTSITCKDFDNRLCRRRSPSRP